MGITEILREDDRRVAEIRAPFDPLTGEGSTGERVLLELEDFVIPRQWIPREMTEIPLIRMLMKEGAISRCRIGSTPLDPKETGDLLIKLRWRYDFAFWAASLVYIKNKGGGEDVLFRLTRPQRKLVETFEKMRLAREPIRVILLKARQWGGSTTTQLYMAWLQLMHKTGLNSLIIAHVRDASLEIKDMFDRMMKAYPGTALAGDLLKQGATEGIPTGGEIKKIEGVGGSQNIQRIPARNCKIKIGTAEKPDSCRGGDYSLVHLSEVGLWQKTDGKSPEDIVQSACSGVLYRPYTMIVYESTAKGTGNFFQYEYDAAKAGTSQFRPLFISWYDIEQNSLEFRDREQREEFARQLWERREHQHAPSNREEPGKYLWWLWEQGATLEAIHWYVEERKGKNDHGVMASEAPSDDVEAFVHSGSMVFDKYHVAEMKRSCIPPRWTGEVGAGPQQEGSVKERIRGWELSEEELERVDFTEDSRGMLKIWEKPERIDPDSEEEEWVEDRYLTVVDIGGRSNSADWSVITVIDRLDMLEPEGKPIIAAQWRGHCDMDQLAWKAAEIAKYYNDSLLVIESNTLETHDRDRQVDGDQSGFILNQLRDVYPNLYARRQSEEDIRQGLPRKYGFHTNVKTKPLVISTLVKAVREGLYTERDQGAIEEMMAYERKPNGSYGALSGKHDDILMTRAIGLHICFYEMEMPRVVSRSKRRHGGNTGRRERGAMARF